MAGLRNSHCCWATVALLALLSATSIHASSLNAGLEHAATTLRNLQAHHTRHLRVEQHGMTLRTELPPVQVDFAPTAWVMYNDCAWHGMACDADGPLQWDLSLVSPSCPDIDALTAAGTVPPEFATSGAQFYAYSQPGGPLGINDHTVRPPTYFSCPKTPTPIEAMAISTAALVDFKFQASICVDQQDPFMTDAAIWTASLVSQLLRFPAGSVKVVSLRCQPDSSTMTLRLALVAPEPSSTSTGTSFGSASDMANAVVAESLTVGTSISDFLWTELVQDWDYGYISLMSASTSGTAVAVYPKPTAIVATK